LEPDIDITVVWFWRYKMWFCWQEMCKWRFCVCCA